MSTGETWTLGHRPALDGIRGIAILLVLAGHGWLPGVPAAGKIGVGVFFTLSGFLITSLLLEERARVGGVNYRAFFIRRARRLLPASLTAIAVLSAVACAFNPWLLTPTAALSAAFYLGNIAPYGLVAHFWSLAVEEQFYLVWPFALAALLRRRMSNLPAWLLVGAASSLALRLAFGGSFLLQQADALLIGCALAAWMHGRRVVAVPPLVPVVAVAALVPLAFLPMGAGQTVGMTAAAILTAVALWGAAQVPTTWLELRPLRWFGRRSYGLYLWHYPAGFILAFEFGVTAWLPFVLVAAPASLLLTVASWRFIERPAMQWRRQAPGWSGRPEPVEAERGCVRALVDC